MGIRDDVGEISENNVTIAEKQEKVYNAGMRAGMMQDPDYSEGYDDGYEQGLTDASGVVWEDLLSGKVPVGKAKEADHATTATNANHADSATNAGRATEADHSAKADHATNANHSATADEASHADTATSATNAGHAESADEASHATTADNAGHATTATVANSANALNTVLPIEKGGTGGTTPVVALDNLGAASIVRGFYIGTGTCGESNPNVLTFDRPVKKIEILPGRESETASVDYYPASDSNDDYGQLYDTVTPLPLYGVHYKPRQSSERIYVVSFDKTVSWYAPDTIAGQPIDRSGLQRNELGKIYEYIAYM